MLEDLAILTGGRTITEELGIKLEALTLEDLGRAKKITPDKDHTTIIEGRERRRAIEGRIKLMRAQIEGMICWWCFPERRTVARRGHLSSKPVNASFSAVVFDDDTSDAGAHAK